MTEREFLTVIRKVDIVWAGQATQPYIDGYREVLMDLPVTAVIAALEQLVLDPEYRTWIPRPPAVLQRALRVQRSAQHMRSLVERVEREYLPAATAAPQLGEATDA